MTKLLLSPEFLSLLAIIVGCIILLYHWEKLDSPIVKSGVILSVFGVVFLMTMSLPIVTYYLYLPLKQQTSNVPYEKIKEIDAIVILRGDDLSRVIQGILAFKDFKARLFVLSGDIGPESMQIPEKDIWKLLAIKLGIPYDAIRAEYISRNTYEHPTELLKIPEINKNSSIGIVTSAWHMTRAMAEFKRYFPNVVAIPVEYKFKNLDWCEYPLFPQADALNYSTTLIHEQIGLIWYVLRHKMNDNQQIKTGN